LRTLRILLAAEESAGGQALRLVAGGPHRIVAVLTSASSPARGSTVAVVAALAQVPVWPSRLTTDQSLAALIVRERVDILLNVHSLHIAHPDVVAAPSIGSFNLHPGPLPRYAGLSVPSWAIYRGERHHGVTVHWMAPKVDAGPIAYDAAFEIEPTDTGLTVSAKAVRHGLPLLARLVDDAAADAASVPATPQDESERSVYPRHGPHGRLVPWRLPARQIVDFVRASDYAPFASPWGAPRLRAGAGELELVRAATSGRPADSPPGTVEVTADGTTMVAAADEWVKLERLRAVGGAVRPDATLNDGERLDPGPGDV